MYSDSLNDFTDLTYNEFIKLQKNHINSLASKHNEDIAKRNLSNEIFNFLISFQGQKKIHDYTLKKLQDDFE
jgi:hypothetical protein